MWKWGYVVASRKEKQFKDSLKWLFRIIKAKHNISQDMLIAQFCEYMEEEGESITSEAIYAYLGGRANFPLTISIHFLNFLADSKGGERRKYPEVLEFIREWYFPMIPAIQKFIDAGKELAREHEALARKYTSMNRFE